MSTPSPASGRESAATTRSDPSPAPTVVTDHVSARRALLRRAELTGTRFCSALAELSDEWFQELFRSSGADPDRMALAAVGGYGRGELCPFSDLDLVLLHDGSEPVAGVADALWYPVWDSGLKLGHAVRTVKETLRLAADDLDTATALLSTRWVAGDVDLAAELAERAQAQWQRRSKRWLARLADAVDERHRGQGEVAFLLEPDLKEARGGLRDVHALEWASRTGRVTLADGADSLDGPHEVLLAARVELQRRAERPGDRLLLQEQDAVAEALGDPDADVLMHRIADAGRAIAWASDESWDRIRSSLAGPLGRTARRDRHLAEGVVLRDGRVALAPDADPAADPGLLLRAVAEAAQASTRLDRDALDRLDGAPAFVDRWPDRTRHELVSFLGAGHAAIPLWETLDRRDLISRILPEWAPVRSRPQRNAYHRFTVDRHLCECAAEAAALTRDVSRPDLLLVGAWLHDLGKGYPGDHTEVGMDLLRQIAPRMGFDDDDTAVLVAMVEHHLLLPDVATRRDLDDDATIESVAAKVGTPVVLELLAALTVADSIATGPAAWSRWKAGLVRQLVDRVDHVLGGGHPGEVTAETGELPPQVEELVQQGDVAVVADDRHLTVVAPDRPGLFARAAGALALNGLGVLAATATSRGPTAVAMFAVESGFGEEPDWDRVRSDVERAIAGRMSIDARLAQRARTYRRRRSVAAEAPTARVLIDNDATEAATVLEVRAPDATGILYFVTKALADLDLDIRSAKVQTLGHEVVDTFYVTDSAGRKIVDPDLLAEVEAAVLHAAAS